MIKAGLTDPTRPLGVFLFLGPTGTGKTEIAKAFAEFLFGSPDRLVRLDMSEFQTPESLERLLADTTLDGHGAGLVSAVRSDPFSVVLLDEFEKAAEPVWDVFLQVFDDGRLTDSHGRLVDFRRCVMVLTSNVGSAIAAGPGLGFDPGARGFDENAAERALRTTFRPELLNRIDRVVMFRPFERAAMRSLLDKELREALARRGLRERPWAVEVDESAYAFLVEKGFSPELGARPLRRAIEHHLLAPLAAAIVEQTIPEGDQFLFVSAPGGEGITVTFVDPDADERVGALGRDGDGRARHPRARAVGARRRGVGAVRAGGDATDRHGRGGARAREVGCPRGARRADVLGDAGPVRGAREGGVSRQARDGDEDRRAPCRTARAERGDGGRASADLVELLASRLHVLDSAVAGVETGDPFELFLDVGASGPGEAESSFAERIAAMYLAWGKKRGMDVERLSSGAGTRVLAVSGLGCWRILAPEAGLHVHEEGEGAVDGTRAVDRATVRVRIAARIPGVPGDGIALPEVACDAIANAPAVNVVVRRYRTGPSPLVRDAVRGYRTGHLDRVLGGGFDLG